MTLAGTIAIAGSTSLIKILASDHIANELAGVPNARDVSGLHNRKYDYYSLICPRLFETLSKASTTSSPFSQVFETLCSQALEVL